MARLAPTIGVHFAWAITALVCLVLRSAAADHKDVASEEFIATVSAIRLPTFGDSFSGEAALVPLSVFEDDHRGIHLAPVYYGECLTNARGGIATAGATQYQGLLELALTIDFERLRTPAPGRLFLLAQNTHGRGITEDFVGDTMVLSNIDSFRNIMQVGEYWWEYDMLDKSVTLRLGKQDVNREFYSMDSARDFMQSGFTLSPNAKLPSYPHQAMAAVALIQLGPPVRLRMGVWDALATTGSWGFSKQDTVLITSEIEYEYAIGNRRLPGRIALGGGYLSEGAVQGEPFGAAHGYSLQIEQQVFREHNESADNNQGLEMFAAFYPRFPSAPIPSDTIGDSFAAGLVYTGLFPRRDKDAFGAGVVWAELFRGGTNRETTCEVFYRAIITDRVALQPDLQYICSPSGLHPDALAIGVRLEARL